MVAVIPHLTSNAVPNSISSSALCLLCIDTCEKCTAAAAAYCKFGIRDHSKTRYLLIIHMQSYTENHVIRARVGDWRDRAWRHYDTRPKYVLIMT